MGQRRYPELNRSTPLPLNWTNRQEQKTRSSSNKIAQATRHTEIERKDAYSVKIRVWIGTSRIAGKGLFAAQNIRKGTRIIQYIGQRISKEETAERFYY
jgi:SET domain-containing protein